MDDDTLMRQVAVGDCEAFGRIVRAHQAVLTRFARRMLAGDADTADDVVQEAFLRLWAARTSYRHEGCLRNLLYRIVRNLCVDRSRRTKFLTPIETVADYAQAPGSAVETEYQCKARALAVRDAVRELPEPQRIVFVLSQYEQLAYRQIADILECPVGTVASRKRLAVEALRRRLTAWMDDANEM